MAAATTAHTYDAGDRPTQITDSVGGTITRTYDNRFDTPATEVAPLGAGTSTLTYTYDAAGRRTQMQVTGQTAVTYGYDDAHRITGITQGTNVVGFTYDAASRRTQATLPNGVTIDYAYDNANQLTGLTYRRNGVTLGNLTYGYDAAGRRTSMGGSYARVNLPPALTSATYDAANKLTNWAGTAQTYDLNGNLTGDGTRTYTWDTRDRLTATNGGGQTSSYVYDAFGRRISRTISGSQTAYVHDGHNPVHTGTGSTITGTLLNGGGLDERYVRTVGGASTALLTDALGSLLHIVDAAGATTATYTYEPYGAVTSSGTDSTGFQYTGREVDVGGLMYYRARYYNPRTARFISEDPIGLAGGVNLYGYVEGSPTNAVDPVNSRPYRAISFAA